MSKRSKPNPKAPEHALSDATDRDCMELVKILRDPTVTEIPDFVPLLERFNAFVAKRDKNALFKAFTDLGPDRHDPIRAALIDKLELLLWVKLWQKDKLTAVRLAHPDWSWANGEPPEFKAQWFSLYRICEALVGRALLVVSWLAGFDQEYLKKRDVAVGDLTKACNTFFFGRINENEAQVFALAKKQIEQLPPDREPLVIIGTQRAILDKLTNRALTAKEITMELDGALPTIKQNIAKLMKKGLIKNQDGGGYFRVDCPPKMPE